MNKIISNKETLLDIYGKHELPYDIDPCMIDHLPMLSDDYIRNKMIDLQGYPIITKRLCESLARFIGERKVLEVMCGKAALTKGLRDEGVNIKPTDLLCWDVPGFFDNVWVDDIEKIDAVDAIQKYAKDYDILLTSWMPYLDPISHKVLLEMREQNPNMFMIYIGEDYGGCCSCDKFFYDAIFIQNDVIDYINSEVFKSHYGIYDHIFLYK